MHICPEHFYTYINGNQYPIQAGDMYIICEPGDECWTCAENLADEKEKVESWT